MSYPNQSSEFHHDINYQTNIATDSLEGTLDRVLFVAHTRLPQNTSNVNIEYAGKPKELYSLCDQPHGTLIYFYFIVQILIYF